jgi:hypothetical protein
MEMLFTLFQILTKYLHLVTPVCFCYGTHEGVIELSWEFGERLDKAVFLLVLGIAELFLQAG